MGYFSLSLDSDLPMGRSGAECPYEAGTMMKFLSYGTLGLILMFSIISMAKPGFYLLSLNTPPQLVMELGTPLAERASDNQLEYFYRAGLVKPFCIDYTMTFINGLLTKWTGHICTSVPPSFPESMSPSTVTPNLR
jgi:hypothetical protein